MVMNNTEAAEIEVSQIRLTDSLVSGHVITFFPGNNG